VGKSSVPYVDYSFSPWGGCAEVSEGCTRCFAREIDRRFYGGKNWKKDGIRREQSESYWADPLTWNRQAEKKGVVRRVLCGTMCDPCEPRHDLDPLRRRLEEVIRETPNLLWMFLTKRPDHYGLFRQSIIEAQNVMIGVTVENQARADQRLPKMLSWPARRYWVSVEPMLGPVTLAGYTDLLELVVCGEESGPRRRPGKLEWARRLRDETVGEAPFFFKQWHFSNLITECPQLDGRRWIQLPDETQEH
jgi:protein gp37